MSLSDGFSLVVQGSPTALLGATALLGLGVLAGWRCGPALRQRVSEVAVACALIWVALALVPLPRLATNGVFETAHAEKEAPSDPTSTEPVSPKPEVVRDSFDSGRTVAPKTERLVDVGTFVVAPPANSPSDVLSTAAGVGALPIREVASESDRSNGTEASIDSASVPRTVLPVLEANQGDVSLGDGSPGHVSPGHVSPGDESLTNRLAEPIANGLVVAWLVGASLVAAWLLIGLVRVLLIVRSASAVDVSEDVPNGFDGRVLASVDPVRPFCFGALRPVIVVPRSILIGNPSVRRSVLHHEATHAMRRDGVGQLVFAIAWPIFFFHPLLWILRHRARFAAEILADDGAAMGGARKTYARDLLRLAEASLKPAPAASIAAAMTRDSSELTRRIEMLMQPSAKPLAPRCSKRSRWLISSAALFALVPSAMVFGAKTSPSPAVPGIQDARNASDQELKAELAAVLKERDELKSALVAMEQRLDEIVRMQESMLRETRGRTELTGGASEGPWTARGEFAEIKVKKGDTLVGILKRALGRGPNAEDMKLVRKLNPELDANRLSVGQGLRVPVLSGARSVAAETPSSGLLGAMMESLGSGDTRNVAKQTPSVSLGSIDPTILQALVQRIEMAAELEVAKEDLTRINLMVKNGVVPAEGVAAAEGRYRTAKSKTELFNALIEMEVLAVRGKIEAQERTLAHTQKLYESGFVAEADLVSDRLELERLVRQLEVLSRDF